MLIAACRESYAMLRLMRMYILALCFCIVALILSIVNITSTVRCSYSHYWYTCDDELASNIKIAILVLFIISTIHTIINMVVANKAQQRTSATPAASYS